MMRKILISNFRQEKFDGKKRVLLDYANKIEVEIGERRGFKIEINARTM